MREKSKMQRLYKYIMVIIITAFITSMCTATIVQKRTETSKIDEKIRKLAKIIEDDYLGEVDEEKLVEGAAAGYIAGLEDEYSEYIPKEQMSEFKNALLGNYVGIGIYMTKNTEKNMIQIVGTIEGSPAAEAGILENDLIISVNEKQFTADDLSTISTEIKGEEGTKVKLKILRNNQILEYEITRTKVNTNPIIEKTLDNNIGYIRIPSFDEDTAKDFKTKLKDLKGKNIKSLIIDLRNNGGGLVTEAVDIAECIVEKGDKIFITVDKKENEEVTSSKEQPIIEMPIVILVNNNTASASEMLTGCLKDLGKAKVVGTTTYGKGVIQEFLTLKDGSGLKLTTKEYYTPNKNKINKTGITPDEIVQLPENVKSPFLLEEKDDTQLQKAIELLK